MLSKIIHVLTALPNPTERTINAIQNLFLNFLWNGKSNKIRKDVSIQQASMGGLGMPDIKSFTNALKITWIRRAKESNQTWSAILNQQIPDFNMIYKVGSEIARTLKDTTRSKFWQDVLHSLAEYSKRIEPRNMMEFLEVSFLYNENIKIGGQSITKKEFIQNEVYLVSQLYNQDSYMTYIQFKTKYPL